MSHYTHFSTEERELSMVLLGKGFSVRAIARTLKRAPSSVSRELRRNSYADNTYSANHADKLYSIRREKCGREKLLNNDTIKDYVVERMLMRWTPEQICGRAKIEKQPFSISFPTIYRGIDSGVLPKQLRKIMRFKCKNKKCKKTTDNRGKIPNTTSIHDRTAGAENRSRFGHWESDTVLGMRKTGCFGTHVERKSGYLVAFKIDDRQDLAFNKGTVIAFSAIPKSLKKSFTVDNGKEFSAHINLANDTGMKVYFCDPYSPWQRGTNENTNGLLRQFYPKKTSFADVTDDELQKVVWLINNRPRKRLGYKTPSEVLENFFN